MRTYYSMGSGIIRYIRASKTFSKFRALRSSVRFEVPCASKFRALRSSVRSPHLAVKISFAQLLRVHLN